MIIYKIIICLINYRLKSMERILIFIWIMVVIYFFILFVWIRFGFDSLVFWVIIDMVLYVLNIFLVVIKINGEIKYI